MKRFGSGLAVLLLWYAATVCMAAPAARAASDAAAGGAVPTARLEPVVVTAGRVEEKIRTVTRAVTVVPQEDIRKNQYQELGDLLRNYGIQTDSYAPGNGLSGITIRGMRSDLMGDDMKGGVLILIDGRRAGTSNLSMIPLVNVERIEIMRGPASVQYGASAIGGVVNIITKRGKATPSAALEAGYGSWDMARALGEGAGAYGPFDFSGGVTYNRANDYKTGSGQRYYNTGYDHIVGYSANLGYNFLDQHRIGLVFEGVDGNDMGSPNNIKENDHNSYTNRYNNALDLTYDGGHKDTGLSWKGRYYHGNQYYRYNAPDPYFPYMTKTETEYQGAQAQLSFTKSFLTLTGGLDWVKQEARTPAEMARDADSTHNNGAGFILAKLAFLDDSLIFSGGLRYDYYKLTLNGEDSDFNHTTPSVGAAYSPLSWLTFRANYGESYRVPTTQEMLGYDSGGWGPNYIGNDNLKPEKGLGWDAGFDINYKALKLGATYFETDYRDKIAARSTSSGAMQYYNMSGSTTYRGIEGQASFDIGQVFDWSFALRPYVNMTYLFKYENNEGLKVPNVSNMDLTYGVNFNHPGIGLNVDLRATYYGHRHEVDYTNWGTNPDYGNTVRRGGETVADLFVTQTLHKWDGAGTLSIKGEIRNIFDVNYETYKDYTMPGRSFWIGLRYDY